VKKYARMPVWILVPAILGGCAAFTPAPPEEVVTIRAQERIDLLMAGDHVAAYEYAPPGYRATATPGQYSSRYGGVGMWRKAEVGSVTCDGGAQAKRCEAVVRVTYRAPRGGFLTTTVLRETWIKISNNWYKYED